MGIYLKHCFITLVYDTRESVISLPIISDIVIHVSPSSYDFKSCFVVAKAILERAVSFLSSSNLHTIISVTCAVIIFSQSHKLNKLTCLHVDWKSFFDCNMTSIKTTCSVPSGFTHVSHLGYVYLFSAIFMKANFSVPIKKLR